MPPAKPLTKKDITISVNGVQAVRVTFDPSEPGAPIKVDSKLHNSDDTGRAILLGLLSMAQLFEAREFALAVDDESIATN